MAERHLPGGRRYRRFHVRPTFSRIRNIPCRSPGCDRWFCNNAGLTNHMRAKHSSVQPQQRPIPPPWVANDAPDPPEGFDAMMDEDHAPVERERELREWEHHTLLCGVFCFHFYLLNQHAHCSFS